MRLRVVLLFAALLLLSGGELAATTYYVDSQNGNDGNDGLAPAATSGNKGPWASIARVNSFFFAPGDSVLFKRGAVWTDGPLQPRIGGAPGGVITIQATILGELRSFELPDPDNNNCIYFGAYDEASAKPRIDCQGGRGIVILHDYIIVEDFHLDNGGNNMLWLGKETGNYWTIINNVDVTRCISNAVASDFGGGNIWLKNLYVYDYGTNGILLNGSLNNKMKGVLVEDCVVENPQTLELEDAITCHRDAAGNDLEGDIIIRNNTILYSGEDGIDVTSGHYILLEGNDIRHSLQGGIFINYSWVSHVEVRGNFIYSNSIDQGVGDLVIRSPYVWAFNNVVAGAGHHCVNLANTDHTRLWHNVIAPGNRTGNFIRLMENIGQVEIKNNIFDFSGADQEINGVISSNIVFDNNCYFGRSPAQPIHDGQSFHDYRNANPLFEPGGFWADPQFAGPGRSGAEHFRLMNTSPCLDSGMSSPVPVDFWGTPRPQGVKPDIGIFELGTVDCNGDPNAVAYPGGPCNDGDNTTSNDVYDADCNCAGTPNACSGIGDADGDGVCTDVDCDDSDPGIAYQPGDACDDGIPTTSGETIQADCSCGGGAPGPAITCSRVNTSSDDAEEKDSGTVDIVSEDLELAFDPNRGLQTIGMRFTGLDIPQGAAIINAHLQFTADEIENFTPCRLRIYGEDSDNPATFADVDYDVSGRPRTAAAVSWAPADWLTVAAFGPAQQTPNLYAIIQEIVDRPGFTSASPVVIIIDGVGGRTAEAFDGFPAQAPELCVEYTLLPVVYDCPVLSANIGYPCDDGDPTTINDAIDADCNCAGAPAACTGIGDNDGDGYCSGADCDDNNFFIAYQPGSACDDGDNTTINDTIDANCNCTGTPTPCTGIGDADGDGACTGLDCDDNDPLVTIQIGGACDDGNPATINDAYDANCNCAGALNPCTGIGDNDGDGICADVDCDDNDPGNTTRPGDACDDGDNTTLNDTFDINCNCTGTPTTCTGIGDADGDGICAGLDCDDNDPNNTAQPGDACDDSDPNTFGETIQADCSCGGGVSSVPTCSRVDQSSDDAEEHSNGNVELTSSDLELATDPTQGVQTVGLRFNGLNIPQGAQVLSAHIQFAVDETQDINPCNLAIYGQASDDAATFAGTDFEISNRPRTNAWAAWSPPLWPQVGAAGPEQQTPDISAIIQEIVNRAGYTSNSSIAIFIDGTGRRTAEAYNGFPSLAPQLCIEYAPAPAPFDCPALSANIGDACNDGDNTTINDVYNANCICAGTPTACTGIGDADGDGICADIDCDDNNAGITTRDADGDGLCSDVDCDDSNPAIAYQPGGVCNDGDNTTINDAYNANCICAGTPTTCTGIGDADGDGVCADIDCDDNNAGITTQDADGDGLCSDVDCDDSDPSIAYQPGDACNDGDNTTINDVYNADCNCAGTPTSCTGIGDADGDGVCADIDCDDNNAGITTRDADGDGLCSDVDCDDSDPSITYQPGDACNDGDNTTINDVYNADCICAGTPTTCTGIGDADGDGVCADIDCDDNNAGITTRDADGDGLCSDVDCDDSNPAIAYQPGGACDDGDNTTINDVYNADCICAGTPTACTGIGDADGDGLCADIDCDDNNAGITTQDADGDGLCSDVDCDDSDPSVAYQPGGACDDGDNTTINDVYNANCNCAGTPTACTGIGDADGDGLCANVDCDDNNAGITTQDADGDGLCSDVDCDDSNPAVAYQPGDACDDGDNTTINDVYNANCICAGTPTACTGIGDADGDGVCADIDCDDNNAGITTQDADGDGLCDDVDCDDSNPAIAYQPGDACNDGDNTTIGETIQADCNCGGGIPVPVISACATINNSSDDAEEHPDGNIELTSSDLELTDEPRRGLQKVGMRFNGLNIPQGAQIISAYIQFTVDETRDVNPCNLTIYGEASNNAPTFTNTDFSISNRPRTSASVAWSPPGWPSVGAAGAAQRTTDLSAVIQEIVNRSNYTSASSIAILIEGAGRRTAESVDGSPAGAPRLCVEYTSGPAPFDCPALSTNIGDACNDGDNTTINDVYNANCICAGTPTSCTGIGDADGDGVCDDIDCDDNNAGITTRDADGDGLCSDVDCDDSDPSITYQPGDTCNDGDPTTINDVYNANCICAGTPTACTGIGDADGDGICADIDCDDNNAGITTRDADGDGLCSDVDCDDSNPAIAYQPGGVCNDGDNTTINDVYNANCICAGTPTTCTGIGDADGDGVCADIDCDDNNAGITTQDADGDGLCSDVDCDDSDPSVAYQPSDACNDGDNTTINDVYNANCICAGTPTACTGIGDADGDGICADVDCDDNNAGITTRDADGDGLCSDVDCDDSDPSVAYQPGDACNDGDNTTINDVYNANCICAGTPTACTGIGDADGDGICADLDCDDNNANITTQDADGDGLCDDVDCDDSDPSVAYQPGDACDDGDNTTINDVYNANCICAGTPTTCTGIGDADGDGVCADIDCDDNNAGITTQDADGDGLCDDVDCDDSDPSVAYQPGDACNDGDPTTINDVYNANCICAGTPTTCTGIGDADGDGVCDDIDCDDNNAGITTQDADGDGLCSDVDCDDSNPAIAFQPGDACNDGDNTTINDIVSANCNCAGTPTACTGIGDADGDGICADVDCDDNNANITILDADSDGVCGNVDCDDNNPGINTMDLDGDGLCDDVDCDDTDPIIAHQPGDACNDGDPTTTDDTIDANCNCVGAPTACTGIGDADGDGICADVDCDDNPATGGTIAFQPGDACDDGDNTTINDVYGANCNCAGTRTACTGIGDADGDGICADVDCDDNNASITTQDADGDGLCSDVDCNDSDPSITFQPGDTCNDGDNTTLNDVYNANCICAGTPTACTGIGDADGDGVCADVDCDDNNAGITNQDADGDGLCSDVDCDDSNPSIAYQAGDACDDGDNTTINDIVSANCNCAGTPTACTGIGDADGDGVCADVDCDDNNAGITFRPGDICDDGDPNTVNDIIQPDCSCGTGNGPTQTCVRIDRSSDDAEERSSGVVTLNSSDLELINDTGQGDQVVGMRFNNLNIPEGATVTNAYIQFTVDETRNLNPCNLIIYGQASDNAATFTTGSFNISNRPRTAASVSWAPPGWANVGAETAAQQTPDISSIIQEIVNRSGYSASSSIAIIIEGTGGRTAESQDGFPSQAPELCVEYFLGAAPLDCPALSANIGAPCDDGDNTTVNDRVDANCNCAGTPTPCTGIGDADADGLCDDVDCDDNNPAITYQPGDACDDGDNTTINDTVDANCNCAGTPTPCTGIGDADGDGLCADVDCDDNNPAITYQPGNACDDGDNTTIDDAVDANCNCTGTPTPCTGIGDADADGLCADVDCDDNNPAITYQPGDACDDGDNTTINDAVDANCNCAGTPTPCTGVGDADGDGLCADVDCDDNDPGIAYQAGDSCDDGNPGTIGDSIQPDCNCMGITVQPILVCSRINAGNDDAEESMSGQVDPNSSDLELANDPGVGNQLVGMRFNNLSIPQGAVITSAYIQFTVDETRNINPCNLFIYGQASDNAAAFTNSSRNISNRPRTGSMVSWMPPGWTAVGNATAAQRTPDISSLIQEVVNRNGYTSGSSIVLIIEGVGGRTAESFNGSPGQAPELCVGYQLAPPAAFDCPGLSADIGDACNDGDNTTLNDAVDADCNCAGIPTACTGIGDSDGDGLCADVDCDDNDPAITYQPGDACDDGNANTVGETIQADCSCGNNVAPVTRCVRVDRGSDDAEEGPSGNVDLSSSDLEMANDPGQGNQKAGMRFNNLNIPRNALITSAYLRFTVDETRNINPCNLVIYGQASDNAATFTTGNNNITNRLRTSSSVAWAPQDWLSVGLSGAAQQTPNLSAIIQEIVNRPGYTASSSVAILIEGTGGRTAESYNGSPAQAPELCVEYIPVAASAQSGPSTGNNLAGAGNNILQAGAPEEEQTPFGELAVSPLHVYPNPAQNRLLVSFSSTVEGQALVLARDLNGRLVFQKTKEIGYGENTLSLDGLNLPDGMYILQLAVGRSIQSAKFVVQQ